MPVRLIDVAQRAGVSIATASRSLNDAPGVSPAVAQRVREVAESMGFVANSHARSLAGGQESSVGLVVGDIGDPYFTEIAAGVIGVAAESGRLVQISHATDHSALLAQVRLLRANRVGAIIIAGSGRTDPQSEADVAAELAAYRAGGGRVAVIGRHGFESDAVLPDNVGAGRAIARHLVELGHTAIAVVAGPADLTSVADRLAGIQSEVAPTMVSHQAFSRDGGVRGARAVLGKMPRTTAIIALSDVMAVGVLAELRARGTRVPQQISVVGFDDIALAAELTPALTTVHIGMAELGAEALRLTEQEPEASPRTQSLPAAFVPGGTTAAPVR